MWDAFRLMKLWQWVVLLLVLAGAGIGVYFGFTATQGGTEIQVSGQQQVVPAQRGNLVNQVSVSGNLVYPETETLTFDTQGTVEKVLVSEGQAVKKGQSLATLDAATIASLQKALAQAKVNLQAAQDALEAAKAPYSTSEMAQAEGAVASQRLALQNAEKALESLLNPTAQALAQAESNVASKRLALQSAEEALESLLNPTAQALAQAEASVASKRVALQNAEEALEALLKPSEQVVAQAKLAVTNAELSVEAAQAALDQLKAQPTTEELARARDAVTKARSTLENAIADLGVTKTDAGLKVSAAQSTYDAAATSYRDVYQKYLGVVLTNEQLRSDPDTLLESLNVDLDSLYVRQTIPPAFPAEDLGTAWSEPVVYAWTYLYFGVIVGTCENVTLPSNVVCVKKDLDAAWSTAQSAYNSLESTKASTAKSVLNAEKAVTTAQEALEKAEEDLKAVEAGPDALSVRAKEEQLAVAKANLAKAKEDLAALTNPDAAEVENKRKQVEAARASLAEAEQALALLKNPDPLEVEAKRKQVEVAKAALLDAEQSLSLLKSPDPLEVEAKRRQVEVAKAALADAEKRLAEMKAGADALTVALKQADVDAAKQAVETAQRRLEKATLPAPFDGVVSAVNVAAGDTVNAGTAIVTLVDPTVMEVSGNVDEIDILYVKEGATASVTLDALPGQTLQGTVSSISPAGTSSQGVVRYPVRIRVTVPSGVTLRAGLTATATVVLREQKDVLLIPGQAVRGTYEKPYVMLLENGKTREQPVSVGDSDGYWVSVTAGLKEGDRVVMDVSSSSSPTGLSGALRQLQGGGLFGAGPVGVPIAPSGRQQQFRQQSGR